MRAYLLQGNMVALVNLVRKRLPSRPPPTPQPAAAVPQHALPQADVDRILRLSPDDVKAVDDAIVAMVCSAALTSDEIEVSAGWSVRSTQLANRVKPAMSTSLLLAYSFHKPCLQAM